MQYRSGFQTIGYGSRFFIEKTQEGGNGAYDTGRKYAENGCADDQDDKAYRKCSEEGDDLVSERSK